MKLHERKSAPAARLLRSTLLATVLIGMSSAAHASPIVFFNFNDDNNIADTVAAGITVSPFTAGAGISGTAINDAAYAQGWNAADAATALANGDYWSFVVTADSGMQFDLTSLDFFEFSESSVRPPQHGPLMLQVWAGALVDSPTATFTSLTGHSIPLTGLNNLTTATIRIIGFDASSAGTNAGWTLDDVTLNGTLEVFEGQTESTPVPAPEPATLALFGAGLAAVAAVRLRRRK